MREEELATLLREAINQLEEAIEAFVNKEERTLSIRVWKAASDVEYATFLMALSISNEDNGWKKQWKTSRDVDVGAALLTSQDLLREAVEALNSDREKAYKKAWFARGHILDVQNKLDRATTKRTYPQRSS